MRTRWTWLFVALLSASVCAPGVGLGGDVGPVDPAVGVREFMKHVERYPGTVRVDGVVSQVFPQRHMLALIDVEEFKNCKVVTCAKLTLPVRWEGPMPVVASTVRVRGEVKEQGVRRVFVAASLDALD